MSNSRIRQVWPRDQVAHLWANQSQESARTAGDGTFYFNGPAVYSYRNSYAIATFSPWRDADGRRIVIMRREPYGVTTGRHMRAAADALAGHPVSVYQLDPGPYTGRDDSSEAARASRWSYSDFTDSEARRIAAGDGAAALGIIGSAILHARHEAAAALDRIAPAAVRYQFREAADYCAMAHALADASAATLKGNAKRSHAARARRILADAPTLPAGFLDSARAMLAAGNHPRWNDPDREAKTAAYNAAREAAAAMIPGDAETLARELWQRQRADKREAARVAALADAIKRARDAEKAGRGKFATRASVKRHYADLAGKAWRDAESLARKQKRPAAERAKYRAAAVACDKRAARLIPAAATESGRGLIVNMETATRAAVASLADGARRNRERFTLTTGAIFRPRHIVPQAWRNHSEAAHRLALAGSVVGDFAAARGAPAGERGEAAARCLEAYRARFAGNFAGSVQAELIAELATVADGRGKYAGEAAAILATLARVAREAGAVAATFNRKRNGRALAERLARDSKNAREFIGAPHRIGAQNAPVALRTLESVEREWPAATDRPDIVQAFRRDGFTLEAVRAGIKRARGFLESAQTVAMLDSANGSAGRVAAFPKIAQNALDNGRPLEAATLADSMRAAHREAVRNIETARQRAADALAVDGLPGDIRQAWLDIAKRAERSAASLAAIIADAATVADAADVAATAARADVIGHWRATGEGSHNLPRHTVYFRQARDGSIVSSMNAQVTEAAGRRLWALIRATVAAGASRSWPWGAGPAVGPFRLVSIGADGSAVVGCHNISAREAREFARIMGWPAVDAAEECEA